MKKVISIILIALCLSPTYMELAATTVQVVQENNGEDTTTVEETTDVEDISNSITNEEVVITPQTTSVATEQNIVQPLAASTIDLSSPVSGVGYTVDDVNKTITFDSSANGSTYELIGSTTEYSVIIPTGVDTTIVLNGVTMESMYSPIEVSGGTLNLEVAAGTTNTITALYDGTSRTQQTAGIEISNNGNLLISGGGYLKSTSGGNNGAGIGGAATTIGTIEITGDVTVDAYGGRYGAGIGTGYTQSGATSTISEIKISGNATVNAYGSVEGAGIGTGYVGTGSATVGTITITDNAIVSANGGSHAGAGIGTGFNNAGTSSVSTINISGFANVNAITASGTDTGGAGIGTGISNSATAISEVTSINILDSAVVFADGGSAGAGIGTGKTEYGTSLVNSIIISGDAQVDAIATSGAGIGTGSNKYGTDTVATINIIGNALVSSIVNHTGAGIGTGETAYVGGVSDISSITISGNAIVEAKGGVYNGSGIGLGSTNGGIATVGLIEISDSANVGAYAYKYGAGIGTGITNQATAVAIVDSIIISDTAKVLAYGSPDGAGIGTGKNTVGATNSVSEVMISDTTTVAAVSGSKAAIEDSDNQGSSNIVNITFNAPRITNSSVKAYDQNGTLISEFPIPPSVDMYAENIAISVPAGTTYAYFEYYQYDEILGYVVKVADDLPEVTPTMTYNTPTPVKLFINTLPTTEPVAATTTEDVAIPITLVGSDANNQSLTYSIVTLPTNGVVQNNDDGTVTYTPTANFNGTDSFTYIANDGSGNSNESTVTITVSPVNDLPTSNDISVTTLEDTPINISLEGTDIDGDTLTYSIVTPPTYGGYTYSNGVVTYTPNTNFNGTDTFTYVASDAAGNSNESTVTITVDAENDLPVSNDISASTLEDNAVDITLDATDADGDALTYSIVDIPLSGEVVNNNDGTVTYTPNTDFNGTDTFTYMATDALGNSNLATVTVTVTPVNDMPTSEDIEVSMLEDGTITFALKATDVDSQDLTYDITSDPANGEIVDNHDGTVTYTPNANFNGTDTFTYVANDGSTFRNKSVSVESTVTIDVAAVNDLPVSNDIDTITLEDEEVIIALEGTDIDGDTLTYSVITDPENGTIVNNNDGTVTYAPNANFNGTDTFTYMVTDGLGNSNVATVTVTITPVNDLPTTETIEVTTQEDESTTITLKGMDIDSQDLTFEITSKPTNGVVINNDDGTVTYTPNANFNGNDTFTYVVSDESGNSKESTVTITVESINDLPTSESFEVSVEQDGSITITLKGSDIDSQDLTFEIISNPANGTIVNNGDGTVTYTPNDGFNGTDKFTYVVNDGFGNSNESTITINVEPKEVIVDDSNKNDEETNSKEDTQSTLEETGSAPFVVFFAIAVSAFAIALYTRFRARK